MPIGMSPCSGVSCTSILLGSDWTRTALPLQHDFCLYVYAAQESITTVEADGSTYFLCQYVLHTSGISSGEM